MLSVRLCCRWFLPWFSLPRLSLPSPTRSSELFPHDTTPPVTWSQISVTSGLPFFLPPGWARNFATAATLKESQHFVVVCLMASPFSIANIRVTAVFGFKFATQYLCDLDRAVAILRPSLSPPEKRHHKAPHRVSSKSSSRKCTQIL